jgi:hypothetical protein
MPNPWPPEKVQALRRDQGWLGAHDVVDPAGRIWLSLPRRPTSGAHSTAIGRCGPPSSCGPASGNVSTCSLRAIRNRRSRPTVVGTHSRGHLDKFPTDFLIARPARSANERRWQSTTRVGCAAASLASTTKAAARAASGIGALGGARRRPRGRAARTVRVSADATPLCTIGSMGSLKRAMQRKAPRTLNGVNPRRAASTKRRT